jgi:hypothetical protein
MSEDTKPQPKSLAEATHEYLKNTPPDKVMAAWKATEPKAIDPVLVQLTCAALTGLVADKVNRGVFYSEIAEDVVILAKATYDELRKGE